MRVIVDSNRLRSEELRAFLGQQPENNAVLTDYAWMEIYKGDPAVALPESLSILSSFSSQVIILKGTKAVGALDPIAPGLANRMIMKGASREFQRTVAAVQRLKEGDRRTLPAVLAHGKAARTQINKVQSDAAQLTPALKELESVFTAKGIKEIRTASTYSKSIIDKALGSADHLYESFRVRHPLRPKAAKVSSLINAFMWRFSLASVVYVITWIRQGSQIKRRPEIITNDLIDLNFATFATYFNELMTGDNRLIDTHIELRTILHALGARVPARVYQQITPLV